MRLGQSAAAAATPTRALPLATSTEIVAFHAAEKRSDDQWYKSMSRSSPASATHVLKKVFAASALDRGTVRVYMSTVSEYCDCTVVHCDVATSAVRLAFKLRGLGIPN